jgi:GT2 family glycosyltransferase
LLDIGCLIDPFFNPVPNRNPERGEVAMVMGACLWIPTSLWQELGGFPEWFGSIGEDLYLCCRARLAGYSVRALGISGYRHRVGGSFGGGKVQQGRLMTTRRRRALSERNKSFVMVATCPAPYSWILIPLHLLLFCMEGLALSGVMRSFHVWREIYAPVFPALWHRHDQLLELRRHIQAKRGIAPTAFFSVFTWQPYKLRMLWNHGLPEIR